jgi:hypothetical protein
MKDTLDFENAAEPVEAAELRRRLARPSDEEDLGEAVKKEGGVSEATPIPLMHCPDEEWVPLPEYPKTQKGLVPFDTVYVESDKAPRMLNREGNWLQVNDKAVRLKLRKVFKLSTVRPDDGGLSPLENALHELTESCSVSFACSLAGYRKGIYQTETGRFLVPDSPNLIAPAHGDWSRIEEFLIGLVGPTQMPFLIGWLAHSLRALYGHTLALGQVLILVGPRDNGKTFFQSHILTAILGGRWARPYQYITGQTASMPICLKRST